MRDRDPGPRQDQVIQEEEQVRHHHSILVVEELKGISLMLQVLDQIHQVVAVEEAIKH